MGKSSGKGGKGGGKGVATTPGRKRKVMERRIEKEEGQRRKITEYF